MSVPPIRTVPRSGTYIPSRSFSSVLLPEPFSPMMEYLFPYRKVYVKSFSAQRSSVPYLKLTFRNSISGLFGTGACFVLSVMPRNSL